MHVKLLARCDGDLHVSSSIHVYPHMLQSSPSHADSVNGFLVWFRGQCFFRGRKLFSLSRVVNIVFAFMENIWFARWSSEWFSSAHPGLLLSWYSNRLSVRLTSCCLLRKIVHWDFKLLLDAQLLFSSMIFPSCSISLWNSFCGEFYMCDWCGHFWMC